MFSCYCHCTICQRILGGSPTSIAGVAPDALTVTEGKDELLAVKTSEFCTRYRCRKCGAPVYSEYTDPQFSFMDFGMTSLERGADGKFKLSEEERQAIKPTAHIFYNDRVMDVVDGLPKFVGFPGMSETVPEK